jgi:hypothetical protein
MIKSLYLIFALLMLSCGQQENPTADLSRIIGENDLVPVNSSFNPRIIKSIGRLKVGCTVTHVGQGLVVTAGHCFFDYPFEGRAEHRPCSETKFEVEWGVLTGNPSFMMSRCTEIVAAEYHSGTDYTIFRVDPYPPTSLAVNENGIRRGERISIYSHPRRRPLEWSGFCSAKSLSSHTDTQFGYECDTDGGSSGAAVLNERNEIVGIHNFYNSLDNLNGGTNVAKTPLAEFVRAL